MKRAKFTPTMRAINNYVVFFLLVSFMVSCCMMLFVTVLADTMGLTFTRENIGTAAKLTFGNVLLITVFSGTIDYLRRKQMVDKPVRQILAAAEKIMQGDFTVRIEPVKEFAGETGDHCPAMEVLPLLRDSDSADASDTDRYCVPVGQLEPGGRIR